MKTYTADDVRRIIQDRAAPCGSVSRWARSVNVSPAYAIDVVSGKTEPGPRICTALGLERVVTYREVTA